MCNGKKSRHFNDIFRVVRHLRACEDVCIATDVTKAGNGEWGMGNGEWGMGNGEWGMGNGEWGMGNGEWGMRNSGQR